MRISGVICILTAEIKYFKTSHEESSKSMTGLQPKQIIKKKKRSHIKVTNNGNTGGSLEFKIHNRDGQVF